VLLHAAVEVAVEPLLCLALAGLKAPIVPSP
jgi:hypothetical protein